MKNKKLLSVLWLGALVSGAAQNSLPRHWVKENSKQVMWVPDHLMTVSLNEVAADADNWGMLNVSVEGNPDLYSQQYKQMSAAYPGYEVERVVADVAGDWTLDVPQISVRRTLQPLQTADGIPYASTTVFVKKADFSKLKAALASKPEEAVRVTGNLVANVPERKVIVYWKADPDTCGDLLANGSSFFDVTESLGKAFARIDQLHMPVPYADRAKRMIFDQCLEIYPREYISSFAELAQQDFSLKSEPAKLEISRETTTMTRENVELQAQMKVQLGVK